MDGGATSQTEPVSTVVRLHDGNGRQRWLFDNSVNVSRKAKSDPPGTFTYDWDDLGRPTSVTHALAGVLSAVVMSQTFDLRGNRTQLAAQIGST